MKAPGLVRRDRGARNGAAVGLLVLVVVEVFIVVRPFVLAGVLIVVRWPAVVITPPGHATWGIVGGATVPVLILSKLLFLVVFKLVVIDDIIAEVQVVEIV